MTHTTKMTPQDENRKAEGRNRSAKAQLGCERSEAALARGGSASDDLIIHGKTLKELHTEIEIQTTAERVWRVLTDFASFPQWNPFIRQAKGEIKQERGSNCTSSLLDPEG